MRESPETAKLGCTDIFRHNIFEHNEFLRIIIHFSCDFNMQFTVVNINGGNNSVA